jgi:hypothetical protein
LIDIRPSTRVRVERRYARARTHTVAQHLPPARRRDATDDATDDARDDARDDDDDDATGRDGRGTRAGRRR